MGTVFSDPGGCYDEWVERFLELQDLVFRLYREGKYEEVLEASLQAESEFPEQRPKTTYWIACMQSMLGRGDEAVGTLHSGLSDGLWWSPQRLRNESDLKLVQDHPRFQQILEACEGRMRQAQADSKPDLIMIEPETDLRASLIALHMAAGNARDTAPRWESAASLGLRIGVLQSSQIDSWEGASWLDRSLALQEVDWALKRMREEATDSRPLLIGGASQGGAVAVEAALTGRPVAFTGFIVIVPSLPRIEELDAVLHQAALRRVRGWILTGDHDYARSQIEQFHEQVSKKINCRLVVEPGLVHDYPPTLPERLREAVSYVLG